MIVKLPNAKVVTFEYEQTIRLCGFYCFGKNALHKFTSLEPLQKCYHKFSHLFMAKNCISRNHGCNNQVIERPFVVAKGPNFVC